MATATSDIIMNVGSITGLGHSDLNSDSAVPLNRPGSIAIIVDNFGYKVMKYVKVINGSSMVVGELAAKPADVSVATISTGSTDRSVVTTGLTANVHAGKMFYVLDNADSAGGAPEGEVASVGGNSATLITLDPGRPLSTALASGDTGVLIATYQAADSTASDTNDRVHGVVVGSNGISDGYYGWVQMEGVCPRANITTDAQTLRDALIAATASLGPDGSSESQHWCGFSLATVTADQVALIGPVQLTLFSMVCGTGAA